MARLHQGQLRFKIKEKNKGDSAIDNVRFLSSTGKKRYVYFTEAN